MTESKGEEARQEGGSGEWVVVHETNTDYEAEIVRDRLDDAGLRAVIDTKRDHAFFLTVGDLARVFVKVPASEAEEARTILTSAPISDDELARAALAAETSVRDAPLVDHDDVPDPGPESGDESDDTTKD